MHLRKLVILSPHRDDAVFSLARTMRHWVHQGLTVQVLNFFTVSEYAPWIGETAARRAVVRSRRSYEDRNAIAQVHSHIELQDCALFDAPLRLALPVSDVMHLNAKDVRREDVDRIGPEITRHSKRALVVAPLGLGGHIDHLTVRQAALSAIQAKRLLFYEDLPYATWTAQNVLDRSVQEVSRLPLTRHSTGNTSRLLKQRWVSLYRTQVTREDARSIAAYNSEGIWAPARSLAYLP